MIARHRRAVTLVLGLVVVIAAGGCGSGRTTGSAASAGTSSVDRDRANTDAATNGGAVASAGSPEKTAKSASEAAKSSSAGPGDTKATSAEGATTTTLDTSVFERDFVFGSPQGISEDDPRPANCGFKPGEICRFRVVGTYGLKSGDVASIEVGAYEDGAPTPAFKTSLSNAKRGSTRWFIDDFPYRARAGVKQVEILARLIDPAGKELARGNPTTFPIGS